MGSRYSMLTLAATRPLSEQTDDLPLIVDIDLLGGRDFRQSGHGHDVAADHDDELGAGREPDLADVDHVT